MRTILFAIGVLAVTSALDAQQHKVTLHGKLFTSGDVECHFFLDPEGDSESVGFDASSGAYLCDWLAGSNAKPFTVILIPE